MKVADSFFTAKDDGTVPRHLKEMMAKAFGTPGSVGGFGVSILENTATTEMYLRKRAEEPKKWECETVCELTVTPGEYFD